MSHLMLAADAPKSPGRRAIELMQEAKSAGEQQVTQLLHTLEIAVRQAAEISAGGDVYPAGVRDLAEKLAEHTAFKAQSIYSIMRPVRSETAREAPARETLALVEPTQSSVERSGVERSGVERSAADEAFLADFPEDDLR